MTNAEKNHIAKHCNITGEWCKVPPRAKYANLPPEKWRLVSVSKDVVKEKSSAILQSEDGRTIDVETTEAFWYEYHVIQGGYGWLSSYR